MCVINKESNQKARSSIEFLQIKLSLLAKSTTSLKLKKNPKTLNCMSLDEAPNPLVISADMRSSELSLNQMCQPSMDKYTQKYAKHKGRRTSLFF